MGMATLVCCDRLLPWGLLFPKSFDKYLRYPVSRSCTPRGSREASLGLRNSSVVHRKAPQRSYVKVTKAYRRRAAIFRDV
ncbi:hypothetical protein PUN28_007919 [Cardiocondyla obscurior]|uniref:Secreted protein n=1 Tax=Cardiocondyla obscurior TaxID=286306 RepID=A0AAW2G0C7_9HYME